jgi:SAM-dependent methyltransferase
MSKPDRYVDYDPIARIYNEYWGPLLIKVCWPALEKLFLPYIPQGAHILDLCCGTGQLVQKLRNTGYQVTGLDGSAQMLQYAKVNSPESEFILDDARTFSLPPSFTGIVSVGDSLNHLLHLEEITCTFQNVFAALLDGGVFLLDMNLEERFQKGWRGSGGVVEKDYAWIGRANYNEESGIAENTLTVFTQKETSWLRSDMTLRQQYHARADIESALTQAGFTQIQVYDAEKDFSIPGQVGRAYFVCHKPSTKTS